jgi:drug/metabolite transporter (DMT)-like permease
LLWRWRLLLMAVLPPSVASRDVARLVAAATCWGLGTVVSKTALGAFPPFTLLAIQLATSVAVVALVLRARGEPVFGVTPPFLGRLGLLNPGIAYALSLVGLTTITASMSVLLWALEPILILVLASIFLHERVTTLLVAMSAVALVGTVLVVYEPSADTSQLVGVALTIAGVVCCAVYSVIARRFLPDADDTTQVVLSQQAHALAFTLPVLALAAVLGAQVLPHGVTFLGAGSALGSGILYYAAAYWFYLGALKEVPASVAAASFYLIPVVGLTAGAALLGDRLAPEQWLGAVLVIAGVVVILQGRTVKRQVTSASVGG